MWSFLSPRKSKLDAPSIADLASIMNNQEFSEASALARITWDRMKDKPMSWGADMVDDVIETYGDVLLDTSADKVTRDEDDYGMDCD